MIDVDLLTINHESSHAVAAYLLGMEVAHVRADRHRLLDGLGQTGARYRRDDDRPASEKARDEAVFLLSAVLDFPGRRGWSDADLTRVRELAAGAPNADAFVSEAMQRALDLVSRDDYRRALGALTEALWLDEDRALDGFVATMIMERALQS